MNRADIVRMAQEAGFFVSLDCKVSGFEAFAALVASAERERMCEQFNLSKELAHEKAKSNEAN